MGSTKGPVSSSRAETALRKPTTVPQPSPFLNFLLEVCCCARPWSGREHFTKAWVLELVVILQPAHRSRSGVECVLVVPVTVFLWQGHSSPLTQSSLSETWHLLLMAPCLPLLLMASFLSAARATSRTDRGVLCTQFLPVCVYTFCFGMGEKIWSFSKKPCKENGRMQHHLNQSLWLTLL